MKARICLFLCAIISAPVFSQYLTSNMDEVYFGRLPSARAEAMGRSYVAVDGDLSSVYFNPASLGTMKGVGIYGNYASPFYYLNNARYSHVSVGGSVNRYLQLAFSTTQLNSDLVVTDNTGFSLGRFRNTMYMFTVSSQPLKNFYIGVNATAQDYNFGDAPEYRWYVDLGIMYQIILSDNEKASNKINISSNIKNIFNSEAHISNYTGTLRYRIPTLSLFGVNYKRQWKQPTLFEKLETAQFMIHCQIQDQYDYEYRTSIGSGLELLLFEILALRAGYYIETQDQHGFPDDNVKALNAFTYGAGVQVPVHKLTKVPLNLRIDYTNLPQPSYSLVASRAPSLPFQSVGVALTYVPKGKKKE